MTRGQALKLRKMMEKASASLTDEEALDGMLMFPHYEIGKYYNVGDRFTYPSVSENYYDEKLFKVNQAHTSQYDWVPGEVPALYTEIAPPDTIPVWKQPTGAQDTYQTGDKVHYPTKADQVYESLIDNNAWSPEAYPQGWQAVD